MIYKSASNDKAFRRFTVVSLIIRSETGLTRTFSVVVVFFDTRVVEPDRVDSLPCFIFFLPTASLPTPISPYDRSELDR